MADALVARLQRAGFKGDSLRRAWAIVMRESGGNPRAFNGNRSTGDQSYGLSQINMLGSLGPARRKQFGLRSNDELLDPDKNLSVMYRMSGGGKDFGPWGLGPNAYKGAPAAARTRYEQLYRQFPGASNDDYPDKPAPRTPAGSIGVQAEGVDQRRVALALLQQGRRRRGEEPSRLLAMLADAPRQPDTPTTRAPRDTRPLSVQADLVAPRQWKGTHETDGLDWNNDARTAEDIMARAGTTVGAPEDGVIERHGSAQGGQALYFRGNSGRTYWLGHIDHLAAVGKRVRRGEIIARVSADHANPHLHIDRRVS